MSEDRSCSIGYVYVCPKTLHVVQGMYRYVQGWGWGEHTCSKRKPHTLYVRDVGSPQTPSTGLRHPSTTAVFSYAIGSWKLSANEQFFIGAQTEVISLQTTPIISHVCFITDHVAYASSNKTKIIWIETELFFTRGGCASCLRRCLGAR